MQDENIAKALVLALVLAAQAQACLVAEANERSPLCRAQQEEVDTVNGWSPKEAF